MNSPHKEDSSDSCEISSVAYRLWQEAGRPPGRYMDFWMKATKLVMDSAKPEEKTPPSPASSAEARP